jgi:hypothetical protein
MLSFTEKQRIHQANSLVHFAGNIKQRPPTLPTNLNPSTPTKSLSTAENFSNPVKRWVFKKAEWLVKNVYINPSIQYAFEQMGAYTVPRIIQQLERTRSITGHFNTAAGLEVGFREIAAGFTNTFLPGLLAKGIGSFIDKKHYTLVSKNMESKHLDFYRTLLKDNKQFVNQAEFLERLEKRLNEAARKNNPTYEFKDLKLNQKIQNIIKDKNAITNELENLVVQLRFPHLVFRVRHQNSDLTLSFTQLLTDLRELHLAPTLSKKDPYKAEWGQELYKTITKTQQKTPHQLWGLLAAGVLTLSTPFIIRLLTRNYYNEDAFPGSKELTKALLDHKPAYSKSQTEETPTSTNPKQKPSKFVLFPYLNETLKQNNMLPTLGTLSFFSVVMLMVRGRFKRRGLSILNPKHWLKVYAFDKSSPISTVGQMELLYGLLCGTRLASSRDDSEYRETGIRDCLLGWPTLTYGFFTIYKILARVANKRLDKEFGRPLLVNEIGHYRSTNSISKPYFDNLGLGEKTDDALKKTYRTHIWLGLAAAGINWALLALLEPQFSIWFTNKFELDKIKKRQEEQDLAAIKQKSESQPTRISGNPFQ